MILLIFLSECVLDEIRSDVVKIVEVKILVISFFKIFKIFMTSRI